MRGHVAHPQAGPGTGGAAARLAQLLDCVGLAPGLEEGKAGKGPGEEPLFITQAQWKA